MITKTAAVVLRKHKYSDTSLIVKAYTERSGLQSFMVKGARSKRSRFKANYFEPFAVLELVAYRKENSTLHTLRELTALQPSHHISLDLAKSAQALFLSEVLSKILQEGKPDPQLFAFLTNAIGLLDLEARANPHFHLLFLIRLANLLGFCPNQATPHAAYFDLNHGEFTALRPEHNYYLEPALTRRFGELLTCGFQGADQLQIPKSDRKALLARLLDYFRLHTDNFQAIKSHAVLETVIN